jgi:hypothetical protein
MGLRPIIMRLATIAFSLVVFAGSVLFAHYAMADGREGRTVRPPAQEPLPQQETYVPTSPDIPTLAGGALPPTLPGAPLDPCASLENAYLAISQATQGADIDEINAALLEVQNDPAGANSDPSAPTLANRLRAALNLANSAQPCEPVQTALRDSVQLAQIASTATPEGPTTGGLGPLSPSPRPVPPAIRGASAHGYCVSISTGCTG